MFQLPYSNLLYQWKISLANIYEQQTRINTLIQIRKLLSLPQQTHAFQSVINMELHKSVMNCGLRIISQGYLSKEDQFQLHNIIWIFVNLCCFGHQKTRFIIEIGIVDFTHKCFQFYNYPEIMSVLFQCIGNITGENNNTYKVQYLNYEKFYIFLKDVLPQYWKYCRMSENATWALTNCFRDLKINANFPINVRQEVQKVVNQYIPLLIGLLHLQDTSEETSTYLLSSLVFITDDLTEFIGQQIKNVIYTGLKNQKIKIRILVAKIFGNIVANTSEGVTMVLQNPQILNYLFESVNKSTYINERSNSAWIISNIMAGQQKQIEQLIKDPIFFYKIKESISLNLENKGVLKELIWSVCNLISASSKEQFQAIYDSHIISNITKAVHNINDPKCLEVYLQGLTHFLSKTKQSPYLNWQIIDNCKTQIEQSLDYVIQINFKFFEPSQNILNSLYQIINYEEQLKNMKI